MYRQFGQYRFGYVCQILAETEENGSIRAYLPQARYQKRHLFALNGYGQGPFCRFRIPRDLALMGVYILTLDNEPFYVGECVHLSKRYNMGYGNISPRNCYEGGQATNCRLNHLIYQVAQLKQKIELWFFETGQRHQVESELIFFLQTRQRWNRKA